MNVRAFLLLCLMTVSTFLAGLWYTENWNTGTLLPTSVRVSAVEVTEKSNQNRFFIFQCKNGQICGGLADRQKGIVTAYIISQIINATFGIDINRPCPIERYLIPNQVDWLIPSRILKGKSNTTWNRMGRTKYDADLANENIKSQVNVDVIFYRGNVDLVPILMQNPLYKKLPWSKNMTHYDVYKYVYDKLFKLSKSTQKKLDMFLKNVGKSKLFCSHIRIGRSATMPKDRPRPLTSANHKSVIDFLRSKVKHEKLYKIFLATDSALVKRGFNNSLGSDMLNIEGPILHVNIGKANQLCDGVEKALLDQKILSLCDTLVISYSGFSRMAALLRGTDDNLYEAIKKNVTKVKRLDPSFPQKLR